MLSLSEPGGGGGGGGRRWRGRWRGLVWGNVGHDFRDHAVIGHSLLGLAGIQIGLVDRQKKKEEEEEDNREVNGLKFSSWVTKKITKIGFHLELEPPSNSTIFQRDSNHPTT